MPRHRSHSIEFKRQVAQEFIGGETLHGLAKRHDIARLTLKLAQPIFPDNYADSRATGAFILIDESTNNTVGAGMIVG